MTYNRSLADLPGNKRLALGFALAAATALAPLAARAGTITMNVNYYTLAAGDPDTQQGIDGDVTNEVQAALGPGGLPVLNTPAYGCASDCYGAEPIHDVNSLGELTYWSPSLNSNVTYTGSGTMTVPISDTNLFPPNGGGGNDLNGFQTAVFSTMINVPSTESLSFTVGADDDAFVYLNNVLVCDLGGVHTDVSGPCTTAVEAAGNYSLQIFYADLHTTEAELNFSINTANVTGVTPEPSSLALLGTGLLGAVGLLRRRAAAAA